MELLQRLEEFHILPQMHLHLPYTRDRSLHYSPININGGPQARLGEAGPLPLHIFHRTWLLL
jgi:hypothetical protein